MKFEKTSAKEFYKVNSQKMLLKYVSDFERQLDLYEKYDYDFVVSEKTTPSGGYYFVVKDDKKENPEYFIDGAREFWLEDFDELIEGLKEYGVSGKISVISKPFDESLINLGFEMIDEGIKEIEVEVADYKYINEDEIYTDLVSNGYLYEIEIKNSRRMEKRYSKSETGYFKII